VAGQRINKVDLQRYVAIDRKMMRQQQKEKSDDDVTSSTGAPAPCRQCSHRVSLVQLTDWTSIQGDVVDSQYSENNSHQAVENSTLSTSQPVNAASNKQYRGLRPSTVQIYNGR